MKKLLLFLFISAQSFGQFRTSGGSDGSVTITPQGFDGKLSRQTPQVITTKDIAIGTLSLNKTNRGLRNVAIGNYALENMQVGESNIAIGHESLNFGTSLLNNIAIGHRAMYKTSAYGNVGIGSRALENNISGGWNTGIGTGVLFSNTTGGYNTALGDGALYANTSGEFNIGIGAAPMARNITGSFNIAIGGQALYFNMYGNRNVAIGNYALRNSYILYNNVALGDSAGASSSSSYNTFIGNKSDIVYGGFTNATAIGYRAIVDASNKVRIGNSNVTAVEGPVAYTYPSDRRLKENINYTNRLGLDFITRLQTVSYNYIADENKTRYDGFIAQDIEKVMKDLGVPFSGLKKSANGTYSLAYSDFVMPLVNAVKEQQAKIERLENQNQILSAKLAEIDEIKAELGRLRDASAKVIGK